MFDNYEIIHTEVGKIQKKITCNFWPLRYCSSIAFQVNLPSFLANILAYFVFRPPLQVAMRSAIPALVSKTR